MMNLSFDMTGSGVVPAVVYTVTRLDGTIERVTPHERDITIDGLTWSSMGGLKSGVLTQRNDGTPPKMGLDVTTTTAGKIRFSNVDRGKYERANVLVGICDAANPVTPDFLFEGKMLGTIANNLQGETQFDLISKFAIPREIFVSVFTLGCNYSFGDSRTCKMPVYPDPYDRDMNDVEVGETIAVGDRRRYKFGTDDTPEDYEDVYLEATAITTGITAGTPPSSTVGATSVDGGVTWTTRSANARAVQVTATDGIRTLTFDRIPDPRAIGDSNKLNPFKLQFVTGEYAHMNAFRGSNWDSDTKTGQVYLPCPHVAVGDWAFMWHDCDRTFEMCSTHHGNAVNHGGYPKQLGAKAQAQTLTLT